MKILYIVNARIPTEKAHGIQIMQMCGALAKAGNEVELLLPNRRSKIKENPFAYYGVEENFKIKKLPVLDVISLNFKGAFFVEVITYFLSLFFYLLFAGKKNIIYTRGEVVLVPLLLGEKKVFWETHIKPDNINRYKKVFKKAAGLITVTSCYKKEIEEKFGVPDSKIFYYPDGVDLKMFDMDISKEDARRRLSLPLDKKIILYTGHLYGWKGVQVLADASQYADEDNLIVFVGGTEDDIKQFSDKNGNLKNVLIAGHKPYSEVAYWQKAADVLILPNSAKSAVSMYYTSPMKLFEYMASGVPIVSSDLPSIREILSESNSVMVKADDPRALADGIKQVLENKELAKKISRQAFADVQNYTWEKRAENILKFIK